jgi:hypothetical protein
MGETWSIHITNMRHEECIQGLGERQKETEPPRSWKGNI